MTKRLIPWRLVEDDQRIVLPWVNPDDLGPFRFFTFGCKDETTHRESLQQRLALH